ncbi:hypothetical protein [Photobacterium damselae]|uniref:hypothetical protein n=1 Tax=Photobacterium damselae TaxID=38293 RepID=UPI001EFCE665|nr:hypothetical protein [Photobacterium damselae]MCG9778827.1 hypothetical protein [Photobacterium damselae]
MINHIEKLIKYILISIIICIMPQVVQASTIYLRVAGHDLSDGLFVKDSAGVTSSAWDYTPSLLPVDSWVPAVEFQKIKMNFKSETGDSFIFDTSIDGFDFGFSKTHVQIVDYDGSCSHNTINSDGVSVFNDSTCISNFKIGSKSTDKISPFNMVRPYINITNLQSVLSGHEKGIYKANVSYKVRYYFILNGVKSYREFNRTVSMIINYNPVELIKITKSGNGFIKNLNYDKKKLIVSGVTKYIVSVYGFIPYGLDMDFDNNDKYDERYLLKNTSTDTEIPYYIKCDKCDTSLIVNNKGYKVFSDKIAIHFPRIYSKAHQFTFDVGFEDIKSNTIRSVRYEGQFNVYFEAIM